MTRNQLVKYYCIYLLIFLNSCSLLDKNKCVSKTNSIFNDIEKSKYNVFDIEKTDYNYNCLPLFTLKLSQQNFGFGNYVLLDGQRIYQIDVYKACEKVYENEDYRVNNWVIEGNKIVLLATDSTSKLNECDVSIFPFIDFSMKVNDTIYTYSQTPCIIMREIFFDVELSDTIFCFENKLLKRSVDPFTRFWVSKKHGIVGACILVPAYSNKFIIDCPIGKTYIEKLDTSIYIMDFSKYNSLPPTFFKSPDVDLKKLKFLSKKGGSK